MDIAIQKKNQSFRLPVDLIERLNKLAKRQNRSLCNPKAPTCRHVIIANCMF